MAEINARREARRRRILENSESRLRRITGRISPDEVKGVEYNQCDNDSQVENDSLKAESNFEEDNVRNGICNINSNTKLQDCTRFDNRHEDFLNDTTYKNIHSAGQTSNLKFTLCTLLFNRINLVLLAGIVNILLLLKLDNLFGQAVIIPYLLLMVGRLYNCATLHEPQDGSLLVAALILCNIKPRLIYKFKILVTLITIVLNDFGLYIFSFVLMRYVIIRYYYYDAIVPINT